MSAESDLEGIKQRIDDVIESLDDVTFALLRQAARESGTRPSADKTLLQARRALEKASRLLDGVPKEIQADED